MAILYTRNSVIIAIIQKIWLVKRLLKDVTMRKLAKAIVVHVIMKRKHTKAMKTIPYRR